MGSAASLGREQVMERSNSMGIQGANGLRISQGKWVHPLKWCRSWLWICCFEGCARI
ncbi:hypothetical protein EMIT0P395_10466 [Pseudomonas sp. IT-P395]